MSRSKSILFMLLFPSFLFIGLTFVYPIFNLLQFSMFKEIDSNLKFVGIDHLKILLSDYEFNSEETFNVEEI